MLHQKNFCFGPTSILVNLLRILKFENEIVFIGTGTALELAKRENYNQYFDVSTNSDEFKSIMKKLAKRGKLLISSMDSNSILVAKKLKMKTVWLDSIFWYRQSIPKEVSEADLFLCQRGIEGDYLQKAKDFKIKNFYLTGPLVPQMESLKRKNKLVVTFGGSNAAELFKVGKDNKYPHTIADIIINDINLDSFEKVVFISNKIVSEMLSKNFSHNKKITFVTLKHEEFIKKILTCKLLITTPGQQTVYEAFFSNTPTITLPASNDTHYCVNQYLIKNSYKEYVISWDMFFEPQTFSYNTATADLKRLWRFMSVFDKNRKMRNEFSLRLKKIIFENDNYDKMLLKQAKIREKMGENGLLKTVKIINNFLDSI